MRNRWYRMAALTGFFAGLNLSGVALGIATGWPVWRCAINAVASVVCIAGVIVSIKGAARGSRSAAGDSYDPGTSPGAIAGPDFHSSGTTFTAPGGISFPIAGYSISMVTHQGAGETPEIAERVDDQPILAYKTALLLWQYGDESCGPGLSSLFTGNAYTASDHAECRVGHMGYTISAHATPSIGCTCGFYAVRDREKIVSHAQEGAVLLDVELFGRVIVFEHGYRAERQRILRVGVAGCWYCNAASAHVATVAPTPWERAKSNALVPMCAEHLPLAKANVAYSLSELAGRLGAPVGYEPAVTVSHQYTMGS